MLHLPAIRNPFGVTYAITPSRFPIVQIPAKIADRFCYIIEHYDLYQKMQIAHFLSADALFIVISHPLCEIFNLGSCPGIENP
jgi:hypothetical protein